MDVPDKLRRELDRAQQRGAGAGGQAVRRPTFEHHPSTASLVDADGRPLYSPPQQAHLVPPTLHSYPSSSSSSSSTGVPPPTYDPFARATTSQRVDDRLPAVYQPDAYAPAPLPPLFGPQSDLSSVDGGGDRTWGEHGAWGAHADDDEVKDVELAQAGAGWPAHLPSPAGAAALAQADPSPDYGLVRPSPRRRTGSLGQTLRSLVPPSVPTRLFLLLVLVQAVFVVAMLALLVLHYYSLEGADFTFRQATSEQKRLPVWLGIFALAHAWLFGMAVEALRARNVIQIFGLTVFNVALLTYSIIQITEIRDVFDLATTDSTTTTTTAGATGLRAIPVELLSALLPTAIGVGQAGYAVLSWFVFREFGWQTYKALGADRTLKKAFERYNVFCCLCKFDVFFFIGFSVQLIYLVLDRDWEFYVTIAALPCSLVLLTLGWVSARRELKWGMYAFIVGLLVGGTYFALKLVRIWTNDDALQTTVKSLTVFAALSLALLLATLAMTVVVLRNFGKGLKQGLDRKRAVDKSEKSGGTGVGFDGGRAPLGRNPSQQRRMSIE